MKKTIKITESQLRKIVNNVLNEQATAPALQEMDEVTLDGYVDKAVDAIDGYVAESDLRDLLNIVTNVAKFNFRGKNAMHEFLTSYQDDEGETFVDDVNSIGVGTITGGGRMKRDILNIVTKATAAVATPKPEVKSATAAPAIPKTLEEFYKMPGLACLADFPKDEKTLKTAKNGATYVQLNLKNDMAVSILSIYYNGEVVVGAGTGSEQYAGKKLVAKCGADGLEINEKTAVNESNKKKDKKLQEQLFKVKPEDTYTDTDLAKDAGAANRKQPKTGEQGGTTAEPKPEVKDKIVAPNTGTVKWQRILVGAGYDLGQNNPYGLGPGIDGKWGKKTQAAYEAYMAKKEKGIGAGPAPTDNKTGTETKVDTTTKPVDEPKPVVEPKPEVKAAEDSKSIEQQRADAGGYESDADIKAREQKRSEEIKASTSTPGSILFRKLWSSGDLFYRDPSVRNTIVYKGAQLTPEDEGALKKHLEGGGWTMKRERGNQGKMKIVFKK